MVSDVVVDSPTIGSDVEYRVRKANEDFVVATRAKRIRRCV